MVGRNKPSLSHDKCFHQKCFETELRVDDGFVVCDMVSEPVFFSKFTICGLIATSIFPTPFLTYRRLFAVSGGPVVVLRRACAVHPGKHDLLLAAWPPQGQAFLADRARLLFLPEGAPAPEVI